MATKNVLFVITVMFGTTFVYPDNSQDDVFHTEAIQIGNGEEVKILDQNNNVVTTVEVFEDEGFQIDKPAEDDEPCLFRKIDRQDEQTNSSDTDTCYVEREVSKEEAKGLVEDATRVFDHCRSLHVLEQQGCDIIDNKATGGNRKKRDWPTGDFCCHYKRYVTSTCVRYVNTSRCCKRIFGICFRRCKRCVSYSHQYILRKLCHYA